jgi:long-chain fatty acid transport protein
MLPGGPRWSVAVGATWLALLAGAAPAGAQGLVLTSVGPVNRSMGGAAVAAPLDATGALYWNPATIGGLEHSELDLGVELIYPQSTLSSAVPASAFGRGVPPVPLAGSTDGNAGAFPLPTGGFVYHPEESAWSYGLGVFTVGGFGSNYPASVSNPILTPQPPNGVGLGAVYSQLIVVQLAPAVACQLTDHLAVGLSPTVDLATLTLDPALFAAPDDADQDGFRTYPSGTHSRIHWGAGFQLGAYYTTDAGWRFGAAVKSPQWFETFRYNSADERGFPRTLSLRFDYPLIASAGAAYAGLARWLFAADVRFIDYRDTKGFGRAGFDATGAGTGLGWDSVVLLAAGVQYQCTDALSLRLGYTFNPNPVPDAVAAFNVASAPIYEHVVYLGASYRLTAACALSAAYFHAFDNSITGPVVTPAGPVRGSSVTTETVTDSLIVGVSVQF